MKYLPLIVFVAISLCSIRCLAETPYLDVQVSNDVRIVTWTNSPLYHLLESSDSNTWTRSTRPFANVGGHNRLRVLPEIQKRFFRLAGTNEPVPRLDWESEFTFHFLTWSNPSPGFTLQSRDSVESGEWATDTETVTTGGGYKSFTLPVSDSIQFFRLSHPIEPCAHRRAIARCRYRWHPGD